MKKFTALLLVLSILTAFSGCGLFAKKTAVFWHDETGTFEGLTPDLLSNALNASDIKHTHYFAAGDQQAQLQQIQTAIDDGADVLAVSVVAMDDPAVAQQILTIAGDLPVVFFGNTIGTDGADEAILSACPNSCFIGTDPVEAGIVQGQMIGNYLLENFDAVDVNGDTVITYAMLQGDEGSKESVFRTQYAVEEADVILTGAQRIALSYFDPHNPNKYQIGHWNAADAEAVMASDLASYNAKSGNTIELVICNNDAMAEGVIAALEKIGQTATPVFGFGLTENGKALVDSGAMTGTVQFSAETMASAMAQTISYLNDRCSTAEAIAYLSADPQYYLLPSCLTKLYITYTPYTAE